MTTTIYDQYKCPKCQKELKSLRGLNIHIRVCHNTHYESVRCDICEKEFKNLRSLHQHERTSHDPSYVNPFIEYNRSSKKRKDTSERFIEYWKNPDYRLKMKEVARKNFVELWKMPEFRERMSILMSEVMTKTNQRMWTDSDRREKQSIIASERVKDPDDDFGKSRIHTCYYNEVKFKSSWEAQFAKNLDELGMRWKYEPDTFLLGNRRSYTPDFFVVDLNHYVEIKPELFITEDVLYKINHIMSLDHNIVLLTENEWDNYMSNLNSFSVETGFKRTQPNSPIIRERTGKIIG